MHSDNKQEDLTGQNFTSAEGCMELWALAEQRRVDSFIPNAGELISSSVTGWKVHNLPQFANSVQEEPKGFTKEEAAKHRGDVENIKSLALDKLSLVYSCISMV